METGEGFAESESGPSATAESLHNEKAAWTFGLDRLHEHNEQNGQIMHQIQMQQLLFDTNNTDPNFSFPTLFSAANNNAMDPNLFGVMTQTQQRQQQQLGDFLALMSPFVNMAAFADDPESNSLMLTPIISPAVTPSVDFANLNLHTANSFSPLSSPALRPNLSTALASTVSANAIVDAAVNSTNPGIKRVSRRASQNATPSSTGSGGSAKRKIPKSPYTIPRPTSAATTAIDPLKISSPILGPRIAGSSNRNQSNSMSPDISDDTNNGSSSSLLSLSGLSPSNGKNGSTKAVFKVPAIPVRIAARRKSDVQPDVIESSNNSSDNNIGSRSSNRDESISINISNSNDVNALTPGQLLYLKSDDELSNRETSMDLDNGSG
ncbi:hypothetical protein HK100_002590, partial [Physocladia obscura]